ncbi:hypothetical protein ACFY71_29175 [Streptomyces cinerochromogenes]
MTISDDVVVQAEQCLRNIEAALAGCVCGVQPERAGVSVHRVARCHWRSG